MTAPATTETPTPAPAVPPVTPPAPPAPTPEESKKEAARKIALAAIEHRGGNAVAALTEYVQDNLKLREKARALNDKVVDDGDAVLKAKDAEDFRALQKLNLTPAQIIEKVTQHAVLQTKVKATEQDKLFDLAAEAMGYTKKGKLAFVKLARKDGIAIEERTVKEKDEATGKLVNVTKLFGRLGNDKDAEWMPLDDFIENDYQEFLPSFYAADDASASTNSQGNGSHTQERKVTPMVAQRRAGAPSTDAAKDIVKQTLDRKYDPKAAEKK